MSHYTKNIMVGVTVLVALCLLAVMILRFSDAPFRLFVKPQIKLRMVTFSAEGISEGTPVYYRGVTVGRVSRITRDIKKDNVQIEATVDRDPPLPRNVKALIRTQVLGGGGSINLVRTSPSGTSPAIDNPLTEDVEIPMEFLGPNLIPQAVTDLSEEIRKLAEDIRTAGIVPKLADAVKSFDSTMTRANDAIKSIQEIVDDKAARANLTESMANFKATSESAKRIGADLEKLVKQTQGRVDEVAGNANKVLVTTDKEVVRISKSLTDRLEQIAKTLDHVESIAKKVDSGNGSAGRLLNDPALYESLLDNSKDLSLTIKDLRRLVDQWEKEGVSIKLGGK